MAYLAAADMTDPWVIFRSWTFDPLVVAGAAVGLWWYIRAVARLRPSRWPKSRSRCFIAGNLVLILALMSPVDTYAELLLSVHMVQHLLLTMVAPPLLLLGAPLTLALRTVRPSDREILLRFLKGNIVRFLSQPPSRLGFVRCGPLGFASAGFLRRHDPQHSAARPRAPRLPFGRSDALATHGR